MARKMTILYKVVSSSPLRLTTVDGRSVVVSKHDAPALYRRDIQFERALGRELTEVQVFEEVPDPVPAPAPRRAAPAPAPAPVSAELVEPPPAEDADVLGLDDLGLGDRLIRLLEEAGYSDSDDLAMASDEELLALEGLGEGRLKSIRKALKKD